MRDTGEGRDPVKSYFGNLGARSYMNSATSAVAGFAGVIDDAILPPAGVELRSDKERFPLIADY